MELIINDGINHKLWNESLISERTSEQKHERMIEETKI